MPRKKKSNPRVSRFEVVIGTNGTGKTTFVEKVITKAAQSGRRVLIVDHSGTTKQWHAYQPIDIANKADMAAFTGIRVYWWVRHGQDSLKYLKKHLRNAIVVFDDCRNYFMSFSDSDINQLNIQRRHMMWDMYAVAHSIDQVPPQFYAFATHLTLFKTKHINRKKVKDIDPEDAWLMRMIGQVNLHASKKPYYRLTKAL